MKTTVFSMEFKILIIFFQCFSYTNGAIFYVITPPASGVHKGELYFKAEDNGSHKQYDSSTNTKIFSYMKDPIVLRLSRNSTIIRFDFTLWNFQ